MRNQRLLPLALSLVIGGCATFPVPSTSVRADQQAVGRLVLRLTGYRTQAIAGLAALEITVQINGLDTPITKRITELAENYEVSFDAIPIGSGTVSARAYDASEQLLSSRQTSIVVKPGTSTIATLDLVIGGSGAIDAGIKLFPAELTDADNIGGYDNAFYYYFASYPGWSWEYHLSKGGMTGKVVYTYSYDSGFKQSWNDGPSTPILDPKTQSTVYPENYFTKVPKHAVLVDTNPLLSFAKVRHLRFSNLYTLDGSDRQLTVDRYYTPTVGLIKESVSEGATVISEMELATASVMAK